MLKIDPNMMFFTILWFAGLVLVFGLLFRWLMAQSDRDDRRERRYEESDRQRAANDQQRAKLENIRQAIEIANYYNVDPKAVIGGMSQTQIPMYPNQAMYELPSSRELTVRR